MDIWFDTALVAHLLALMVAGATVVSMPMIAQRMANATPEARASLGSMAQRLGLNSRIAFAVLLISGPLMLWLRYGGIEGASVWFWVKMGLIVLMIIGMVVGGRYRGKAQGNPQAARIANAATMVSRLSLLGIVVAAVLAFN
jgi:protoporphyrinogen IX oxidase